VKKLLFFLLLFLVSQSIRHFVVVFQVKKNHFYFFKVQLYWLKENCTKKIDIWIVGNKKNGNKKYSFVHIFFVFFLFLSIQILSLIKVT